MSEAISDQNYGYHPYHDPFWYQPTRWDWGPTYSPGITTAADYKSETCRYCGLIHTDPGICPRVKAIEYHPDGTIKRVEFR